MEISTRKLNLGCGYDIRPGYLNVDLHERHGPDLVADVTKLDMLPSGKFEEIVAQDMLEHLERHKVQGALDEWARLLQPGGVLHVRVPSLEHMFKMLCRPENRPAEKAAEVIHLMYGTQAYTGDYHLSGFTAAVLQDHLARAGLKVCSASILHDWLFDITARKCAQLVDHAEIVHEAYFKVLGRPADAGGLNHFKQKLAAGTTPKQVYADIAASDEANFIKTQPSYLLGHASPSQPVEPSPEKRRNWWRRG